MENWIDFNGSNDDIVLSSRVRLARDMKSRPFPLKENEDQGREIVKLVEDAFYSSVDKNNYKTSYLWESDDITDQAMLEKHLISPELIQNKNKAALILSNDNTESIMINEEDHVRIQCVTGGLNLKESFNYANKIDDILEEKLEYAFDEKLGYLTACPTNIGTGLRGSVMLHLPALTINNEMNRVLNAITQVGMTIRGLYGEGSKVVGNIYQISNQITLGLTEEEILNNIAAVVSQIINQENYARQFIMNKYKYELEDRILRSLGILKTAVIMSEKELMELLSSVRMGIEMNIVKNVNKNVINSLMIDAADGIIQKNAGRELKEKEINIERANIVKEKLNEEGD